MQLEEHFDADEILREPGDYQETAPEGEEEEERRELTLGQDRIIDPEEIPMDEDDLYDL